MSIEFGGRCTSCQYRASVRSGDGGGRVRYRPATCNSCKEIQSVAEQGHPNVALGLPPPTTPLDRCPSCGSNDVTYLGFWVPDVLGGVGDFSFEGSEKVDGFPGSGVASCPKCNAEMHFLSTGMWDAGRRG